MSERAAPAPSRREPAYHLLAGAGELLSAVARGVYECTRCTCPTLHAIGQTK